MSSFLPGQKSKKPLANEQASSFAFVLLLLSRGPDSSLSSQGVYSYGEQPSQVSG